MRNSTRSIAVAAATVLATIALGTPVAGALASTCMYPPSTPVLSVGLSTTAPTAGQPVYVRGRMSYNKCGVSGSAVTVRAGGRTIGTRTTDTGGNYSVRFTPTTKTSVYAAGAFNRVAVKSRTLGVAVRTNLRGTSVVAIGSCRIAVRGSIYPVRKGLPVVVQRRITQGTRFVGWSTLATARTTVTGSYAATVTLPCASKAGVSTYVAPTQTNAANRSSTITVTAKR
ncbi:MAG: hypothetical protein ABI912_05035 [Actinomycetota bacterium]